MGSYKISSFERCINAPVIDLRHLRTLSWNGIPTEYRAITWKLLLGYMPANSSRQKACIRKRREEYRKGLENYYYIDDEFRTSQDHAILKQVLMDVPRTAPNIQVFSNERVLSSIERILFLWAIRNPASSYVQGINDLVTPFFAVFLGEYLEGVDIVNDFDISVITDDVLFQVEADTYGCLTGLLSGIQDHYTPDQPGIHRMVKKLELLVKHYDSDLCIHFEETGLKFLWFTFKWMNCFLMREFSLSSVIRMWDTYFSEEKDGFEEFHVYVCAAILRKFSSKLKAMEFESLFEYIQNMPTIQWSEIEVDMLLSQAHVMRLYGEGVTYVSSQIDSHQSKSNLRISPPSTETKVPISVFDKLRLYRESFTNSIDDTKPSQEKKNSIQPAQDLRKTSSTDVLYDLDILMY